MNVENVNINSKASVYGANKQGVQQKQSGNAAAYASNESKKGDRLELSQKAKSYQAIREKIASGEYDKPEVLMQVAINISKTL